ncbi:MAG: c-type cytochrome [Pseudomonadota bacterium]
MARGIALIAFLAATPALADYDPSQYPAYETCALCHGLFGVSHTGKFPNLGGQKQAYIEAQIRAFRDGHRTNDGGQMVTIVTELQPEDIPFVAEWFASQDPPAPYPAEDTAPGAAAFAALECATCHDNAPDGDPTVPHLTAQKPDYLAKQMSDFRDGRRDAVQVPGLHAGRLALPDSELEAIAVYLAAQERP